MGCIALAAVNSVMRSDNGVQKYQKHSTDDHVCSSPTFRLMVRKSEWNGDGCIEHAGCVPEELMLLSFHHDTPKSN